MSDVGSLGGVANRITRSKWDVSSWDTSPWGLAAALSGVTPVALSRGELESLVASSRQMAAKVEELEERVINNEVSLEAGRIANDATRQAVWSEFHGIQEDLADVHNNLSKMSSWAGGIEERVAKLWFWVGKLRSRGRPGPKPKRPWRRGPRGR